MNMQTTNRLTAAEAALIEAFNNEIGELPGDGAVIAIRDRLLDDLKTSGLPTRRVEAWHYTDLKNLLRAVPAQAGDAGSEARDPLVEGATVLPSFRVRPDHKARAGRSGAVELCRATVERFCRGGLGALDKDDAVGRINGSFVRDGYVIDVPAGTGAGRAAGNPVRSCRRPDAHAASCHLRRCRQGDGDRASPVGDR
jgi:Fe-S cluster assembly protein SufD